jgi:predicted DNA-binding transcriptional regulator AlpA
MMKTEPIETVFLTRRELRALGIRVSNTTLLRWERLDRFPRRGRLAGTTVVWFRNEILKWIEDRDGERASHVYTEY